MAARLGRAWSVMLLLVAAVAPASAHPVPFSYLDLHVNRVAIDGTLVVHVFDAAHDLGIEPPEKLLDPRVAGERASALIALLSPRVTLAADGRTVTPEWSGVDPIADRQSVRLHLRFPLTAPPGNVAVTAQLFPYDPNHQTFLNVYDGEALTQAILDRGRPGFEYFAGMRQGALAVVKKFVRAGIQHILIGPDHLLFLVGLLLLGGTLRQLAVVVTAFTVAH